MKIQLHKSLLLGISLISIVSSCTDPVAYKAAIPAKSDMRFLVLNEGQYGKNTSSVSCVDFQNEVTNDLFRTVNDRPLGDVGQSIVEIGDKYYIVLNNSRKIEVVTSKDMKSFATIPLPEGIVPAYITYLGGDSIALGERDLLDRSGKLYIIDIAQGKTRRSIDIGSATQCIDVAGKLFVPGNKLRVLTLGSMVADKMREIKDLEGNSIATNGDAQLVKDANNHLWTLTANKLICIDVAKEKVLKEVFINDLVIEWNSRLGISQTKNVLYFTARKGSFEGVAKFAIADSNAPSDLIFSYSEKVKQQYNFVVSHEGEDTFLICDATDFSSRGFVYEYSLFGKLLNSFEVGITPQYIHLLK
ncbi:MAG: DUF5074 domain-containing protein [Bacteroidales bacterium]